MSAPAGEAAALRATQRASLGILEWRSLISMTILVIYFIPIRRFTLAGGFGFELEPYRVVVSLVLLAWFTSLLIDPRVRLRPSGLGLPLTVFVSAVLGSVIVNSDRIHALALENHVLKQLMFFYTFVLMFLMVCSVVRTLNDVERLVRLLVAGAAVVAFTAVVEYWTQSNVYDYLPRVLPVLQPLQEAGLGGGPRGGLHRAAASAQHPIALGAVLVLILPFALYLAVTASRRWLFAAGLLVLGAFTTVSRTSLLMLALMGLVFLCLRPRYVLKLWPWALPLLIAAQLAVPGALGTFRYWLDKPNDVVSEQERGAGRTSGDQGRLADIGPSLTEFSRTPFLGQGYGTRISDYSAAAGTQILDDQWLKTLLETGLLGALSLLWLLTRAVRRSARWARTDTGAGGWLAVAFTASIASYTVSMLVYDAFSFTQSTYLLFIVLALSCVGLRAEHESARINAAAVSAPRRLSHSPG